MQLELGYLLEEYYNVYIEVKGYKTKRDEAKWSQFLGVLLIIDKTNIKKLENLEIEHVLENFKYGQEA